MFSPKTIVLVGIYNQQFQGTIILMVLDFQGYVGRAFLVCLLRTKHEIDCFGGVQVEHFCNQHLVTKNLLSP